MRHFPSSDRFKLTSHVLACLVSLVAAPSSPSRAEPPQSAPAEAQQPAELRPVRGTLRVHKDNPRYFADDTGRAVYLTGSHTWSNLMDRGASDPPPVFDF